MTEEERDRWRQFKAETARDCEQRKEGWRQHYGEMLDLTDPRIMQYCDMVCSDYDAHNLYEVLAVRRFFDMLGKYAWNARRVTRFVRFYETLKFSGVQGRRSYRLTPVQTFQFANIFGLMANDGRRLIRDAYLFVPRKYSKTTSMASLAVYEMLFGDANAQAYVGANSYNQAKICFDEIRAILFGLDPNQRHLRINREKIFFKDGSRDSLIQCLTSNAKTLDGLFASLVIMDEYAQARDTANRSGAELKTVLETSMGPRREPLVVVITTASDVVDGPFAHELEGVKAVLRGELENDSMFAAIFEPDVDDKDNDPKTWHKVQPHIGVTVAEDFYEKAYAKALMSADNMLAFRTKLLNVFTINDRQLWLPYSRCKDVMGDFDIDKVKAGAPCTVAFDLSVHDDFSAVAYTLYSETTKRFFSYVDYYFPEGSLSGHPNEQLYRTWASQGHLRLCKGSLIDVRMIADDILRRAARLNILRIGYDAYKSQELVNILSAVGGSAGIVPYKQTIGSFNLPVEAFELMFYADPPKITISNNPITLFCMQNCVIEEDNLENRKPIKISQDRKIDGVIAILMTIGLLNSYER